jgi:hypothetical protein
VVLLLTLPAAIPPSAVAAPPSEVRVEVVSYRHWVVEGPPDVLFIAGEIRNTSPYRINGYVTVGISPGTNNAPDATLGDTVMLANLAPGQRAPFLLRNSYATGVGTVKVTFATAGGYTGAPTPSGAIGVSTIGPVEPDSTGGGAVLVELRNGLTIPVVVDQVIATLYGSTGKVTGVGSASPAVELQPNETRQAWVATTDPVGPTTAAVSVNARPTGGGGFHQIVAWTNWFHDVGSSKFQRDIAWIAERRITSGCASFRFCPKTIVSRGQMASFLAKALKLPPASRDYFTDDESSTHEANINRIAAAGITGGCGPSRFCPGDPVSRAQMASFIARAFHLPTATRDFFTDDERSSHEANINRIAAAGITGGCDTGKYCPSGLVTRGQMAAFLRRALTP